MVDGGSGFVATAVTGLDQPPHHVDVFAGPQAFIEPIDRS
jgi:hypothetical protein